MTDNNMLHLGYRKLYFMINFFKKPKKSVDVEKCGSCGKGELIKEFNEGGNHVKQFSCGHRKIEVSLHENVTVSDSLSARKIISRTINEGGIPVTDSVSVSLGLYFELTESVSISGIKKNSNDMELIFEGDNPNMLKAFRINVRNYQNEKEILTALQHASRFTNLITLKTGMFVFHKRPRKIVNGQITNEGIGYTIGAVLTKLINLDMTDGQIVNLLNNDSRENQQLAHFANGQRAFDDDNYGDAIKEFYQVIEYENLSHLEKYKYLRHGVSHAELSDSITIDKLKTEFNIVCIENPNSILTPKGKYVDITSPEVQDILEKQAGLLRQEAIRFIDGKVQITTN